MQVAHAITVAAIASNISAIISPSVANEASRSRLEIRRTGRTKAWEITLTYLMVCYTHKRARTPIKLATQEAQQHGNADISCIKDGLMRF